MLLVLVGLLLFLAPVKAAVNPAISTASDRNFAEPSFRELLSHRADAGAVHPLELPVEDSRLPEAVMVDVTAVLSDVSHHPLGINVNYWTDDDNNPLLPSDHVPLETSLKLLGAKYLRYPGGWKSEQTFWSIPPYTSSQPVLARPDLWPGDEPILVQPDGSWAIDPLDFDEFIDLCQQMGAEPYVVVPLMPYLRQASAGVEKPSRQQVIDHAVAWVKYANQIKGYGIKYWEIGNETYLEDDITADIYGVDARDIAAAMKQMDPTIWIGVGGDNRLWFDIVLRRCAAYVDFLSIHAYPFWRRSAAVYLSSNPNPLLDVEEAKAAIQALPSSDSARIKIIMSEWAAGSLDANDAEGATVERGVMTFDLQGQILQNPEVEFSQFWTTHNIYEIWNTWNPTPGRLTNGVLDALWPDGRLSAVGTALQIWADHLQQTMLATTSTPSVRCFATRTPQTQMNLFLVNKLLQPRRVIVTLNHLPSMVSRSGERWVYAGRTRTDQNPRWTKSGTAAIRGNQIALTLDASSVTMVSLNER